MGIIALSHPVVLGSNPGIIKNIYLLPPRTNLIIYPGAVAGWSGLNTLREKLNKNRKDPGSCPGLGSLKNVFLWDGAIQGN